MRTPEGTASIIKIWRGKKQGYLEHYTCGCVLVTYNGKVDDKDSIPCEAHNEGGNQE